MLLARATIILDHSEELHAYEQWFCWWRSKLTDLFQVRGCQSCTRILNVASSIDVEAIQVLSSGSVSGARRLKLIADNKVSMQTSCGDNLLVMLH